jgi:hypothetical protein
MRAPSSAVKPPVWYWIAGTLGLIWYLVGLGALVPVLISSSHDLRSLPEAQRALYQDLPTWTNVLLSVALLAGLVATLLLLARQKAAMALFAVALVSTLAHDVYWFGVRRAYEVGGFTAVLSSALVVVVLFVLMAVTRVAHSKSWML